MKREFLSEHARHQYDFFANARVRRALNELGAKKIDFYGEVLAKMGIEENDVVLDIGTGSGEDAFRIAAEYKPLKVIGVEPQISGEEEFENNFLPLKWKLQEAGINNVEIVPGYVQKLPLPDNSIDKAIVAYPDFPRWRQALQEIRRVVKQGGTLTVITSGSGNKLVHQQKIEEMAVFLGCKVPKPPSSKSKTRKALKKISKFFKVTDIYPYTDNMVITEEEVPIYLGSIDSYRSLFTPPVQHDGRWVDARKEIVEEPIQLAIAAEGAFYDSIDLAAIFCENTYSTPLTRTMGQIGLMDLIYRKPTTKKTKPGC